MPKLPEIFKGLLLYKIKQGKNEQYLKDDGALSTYLINNAVEEAELAYSPDAPPLKGPGLEKLLRDYTLANEQIERLGHRYDRHVLAALRDLAPLRATDFADDARVRAFAAQLEHLLAATGIGRPRYRIEAVPASAEHPASLRIAKDHHGLSSQQVLSQAFFASTEYAPIAELAAALDGLVQAGARVSRGGRSAPIRDFHEAQAWLMEEAKKGRTIQRFKGLGEMNPEQLWETTVNPETRRLLQVRIEDAVAADQIFATLMGDVVEPRRQFIEQNALRVSNLDV